MALGCSDAGEGSEFHANSCRRYKDSLQHLTGGTFTFSLIAP